MDKNGFDKSGLLSGITSYELVEGQSDEPSLYYFPLEVSISTFVGRSSEFPDKLTLANFLDRLEQLGDDQCLIDYLRFRFALRCSLEEFIDYESGTTDFDSELFCRVAEAYREYGDLYRNKAEYGNSDSKWQALADGELLLTNFRLSINQLALCDAKYQLDDLTAVGYPTATAAEFCSSRHILLAYRPTAKIQTRRSSSLCCGCRTNTCRTALTAYPT